MTTFGIFKSRSGIPVACGPLRRLAGRVLFLAWILSIAGCATVAPPPENAPGHRLRNRELEGAILGALVWLDANQVRERPGRGSVARDASDLGDGCRSNLSLSLPGGRSLPIAAPKGALIRNDPGGWSSELHLLPHRPVLRGRGLIGAADSNCFTTAFTLAPLFLIDDSGLEKDARFVSRMRREALGNLERYRRDSGFAFWRKYPGATWPGRGVAPLNAPLPLLRATAEAYRQPDLRSFQRALRSGGVTGADLPVPPWLFRALLRWQLSGRTGLPPTDWLDACLDSQTNPGGTAALVNIPADADDTAAVVVAQLMAFSIGDGARPDLTALKRLARFRDVNRLEEDGRDQWKGRNTGAFLTWMADEAAGAFADPDRGVIPLGVNNVDAVINANAVHALALAGQRSVPGYREAKRLVARCALERRWPDAGLYYPQQMMFPYAAARAWHADGACDPELKPAMQKMLMDLLDLQERHARRHPFRAGAFPGGEDPTDALATAMGLSALLHLGDGLARGIGAETRYAVAVDRAAGRLLDLARRPRLSEVAVPGVVPVSWEAGLFFSASFQDMAHWRSEALTTALAMEALAAYAMGFERSPAGPAKRLHLVRDSAGGLRLSPR